jgi:DNA-directed RNA polymerase specialized sigma24 family protein
MDDEAILAGLDGDPDAFAVFYRRHVAVLLEYFAGRTHDPGLAADLCAETFATALDDAIRFDPGRGLAVDWLCGIARRLLDEAARRGVVEGRARRRLGLAALEPGDGFVEALEQELVEAARFRACRRRGRLALPPVRIRALAVVAALTLVAVVAALAVGRDGSVPTASDRRATQASFVVALAPMLSTAACRGMDVRGESAAEAAAAIGVTDGLLGIAVRVVSPLGVSDDADCVPARGPGACLVVEDRSSYRCFGLADVRAGRALARAAGGSIVGVVPDDVDRVTLTAGGRTAGAVVVDNVYEARLGVPSGTPVRVALDRLLDDECQPEFAPELPARVATCAASPTTVYRCPKRCDGRSAATRSTASTGRSCAARAPGAATAASSSGPCR